MILPSVRAFLAGIIDYAGLFPPTNLPLEKAIRNYAEYRAGRDAWMLGRFVIPAGRLAELDSFEGLFTPGMPFAFAVLGRGGDSAAAFLDGLGADLQAVEAFRSRHGERVAVESFEVKLPLALPRAAEWPAVTARLRQAGMNGWYEWDSGPSWREVDSDVLAVLAGGAAGIKLRCGGPREAAFPSPEQVAFRIATCQAHGLRLKFTAGLHHPFRHFDRDVQGKMHGFVNVFGAAILAHALPLAEEQVRAAIEDEDPSNFGFDEIGFGWKQYHALTDEIIAARRQFVVSFGSCSFDEPRHDLRALHILP
jgi:hypothetical protein